MECVVAAGELPVKQQGRDSVEHRTAVTAAEEVEDSAVAVPAVAAEVEEDNAAVGLEDSMAEEDSLRLVEAHSIAVVDGTVLQDIRIAGTGMFFEL